MSVQSGGSLAAIGDANGTITLLQLCDGLIAPGPNEKNIIGQMFDRETKREKSLELIKKQAGQGKKEEKAAAVVEVDIEAPDFKAREKTFFQDVGMTGDVS